MASKSPASAYTRHKAAIKAFVSFDLPKQPSQAIRRKARDYFKLIYGWRRPSGDYVAGLYNPATDVPIASRSVKRLRLIQESEGQPYVKGIRVAFVETVSHPLEPGKLLKPRIVVKGGKVIKSNFDVSQTFYPFEQSFDQIDSEETLDDIVDEWAEREVGRILEEAPHIKSWVVKVGKRQTANPRSRTGILEYVKYLCIKYGTAGEWLRGLVAFQFHNQKSLFNFLESRKLTRKGNRGKVRKIRRGD